MVGCDIGPCVVALGTLLLGKEEMMDRKEEIYKLPHSNDRIRIVYGPKQQRDESGTWYSAKIDSVELLVETRYVLMRVE